MDVLRATLGDLVLQAIMLQTQVKSLTAKAAQPAPAPDAPNPAPDAPK
jgi:hypothetical protein